MDAQKYYCSGETLSREIADEFADTNNLERGVGDALLYEVQIRRSLEKGVEAGAIKKRCWPSFQPCDDNIQFESCCFEWEEVRLWVLDNSGEDWPLIPPPWSPSIQRKTDPQKYKRPAFLFCGDGFSEEAQKITTLSKYLELDTWTPLLASLLVCGIQPDPECKEIPRGAMSLGNVLLMPTNDPFHEARRVLLLWNSRENAPAKVRPAAFVAWCKTKNINTDWLRDVPLEAVEFKHTADLANPGESAGGQPKAPMVAAPIGVIKAEILAVDWPMPKGAPVLENILNNAPKWVETARTKVGKPGGGAGGSHLWNPASLAVCLATKTPQKQWVVGKKTLAALLRENFPEYLSQWEESADYL